MSHPPFSKAASAVAMAIAAATAAPAHSQTVLEHSAEVRFQMDVQVPAAPIERLVPPGFTLNIATQGNAKDCNLRVVFIDRQTIHDAEGRPVGGGANQLVYLIVPVRDPQGNNSQLVIGGITADPNDAPGPFGVYLPASTFTVQRTTRSSDSGGMLEIQDWVFQTATGERIEMHIALDRVTGNRGNPGTPQEVRFYSAANPSFYQISRREQVLFVSRNVTTTPQDRVREFSFTAGGGRYAEIFDGTERMLSWDDIIWQNQTVLVP